MQLRIDVEILSSRIWC